jgi:hypothetical protein
MRIKAPGKEINRLTRFMPVAIMTAIMAFMVTLVATFINFGLRVDFLPQGTKACIDSWPIAAHLTVPVAKRLTTASMAGAGKTA